MSAPDTEIATLAADLPDGAVVTDPAVIEGYRRDAALDPEAGVPRAVVRATGTEDVQTVLRWASAHHVAVVPRGAGSGLAGGANGVDGGIILSTERMRQIRIDT
nr:FAD-binding protein [Streptomyces sp. DSM 41633]